MRRLLLSLCLLCGVAALEPTPATTTAPPTYTPTLVTDAPSVRSHFWCDPAPGLADIQAPYWAPTRVDLRMHPGDKVALEAFRDAMTSDAISPESLKLAAWKHIHPLNLLANWNDDYHPCQWCGVICECNTLYPGFVKPSCTMDPEVERVHGLDFGSGVRPASALAGTIPSELGSLTESFLMYLHGNALIGTIPTEVGRLTKLVRFLLRANALTGSLPSELGNTRIKDIFWDGNQLEGPIPEEWCPLFDAEDAAITTLHLANNALLCDAPPACVRSTVLQEAYKEGSCLRFNSSQGEARGGFCDATPPSCEAGACLTTPTIVTRLDRLSFNFSGVADAESGVLEYRWMLGTAPGLENAKAEEVVEALPGPDGVTHVDYQFLGSSLTNGFRYHLTLKAVNGACPEGVTTLYSQEILVDSTPPECLMEDGLPSVFVGALCKYDTRQLVMAPGRQAPQVCWKEFVEGESRIQKYEVALVQVTPEFSLRPGTVQFDPTQPFVCKDGECKATFERALTEGGKYCMVVRASNNAGASTIVRSTEISVQQPVASQTLLVALLSVFFALALLVAAAVASRKWKALREQHREAMRVAREREQLKRQLITTTELVFGKSLRLAARDTEESLFEAAEVAFVFTDIEESTSMALADPEAYHMAQEIHDTVIRRQIVEHGGYEVNTQGDAFEIALPSVAAAVRLCMDVQQALLQVEWSDAVCRMPTCAPVYDLEGILFFCGPRVRMGIHLAKAGTFSKTLHVLTQHIQFEGEAQALAAEVGDCCDGGQVIMTQDAFAALDGKMQQLGVRLNNMGVFQFQKSAEPISIYEVLPSTISEMPTRSYPPQLRNCLKVKLGMGLRVAEPPLPNANGELTIVAATYAELEGDALVTMHELLASYNQAFGGFELATLNEDQVTFIFQDPVAAVKFGLLVQVALMTHTWALSEAELEVVRGKQGNILFRGPRVGILVHTTSHVEFKGPTSTHVGDVSVSIGESPWTSRHSFDEKKIRRNDSGSQDGSQGSGGGARKTKRAFRSLEKMGDASTRAGDYGGSGLALAREMARVVHGGQLVVTQKAWIHVLGQLPGLTQVVSLGTHVLPRFEQPQNLMELSMHAVAERDFPPFPSKQCLVPGFRQSPDIAHELVVMFAKVPSMPTAGPAELSAEEFRTAYGEAVQGFCGTVRSLLGRYMGYECKEPETGKFTLAFSTLPEALAFAVTLQAELLQAPCDERLVRHLPACREETAADGSVLFRGLRASVGLAFGRASFKKPLSSTGRADYFGSLPNKSARLMSSAAPGQIIVDGTKLRLLLGGDLPAAPAQPTHGADTLEEWSRLNMEAQWTRTLSALPGCPDVGAIQLTGLGVFQLKGIKQPVPLVQATLLTLSARTLPEMTHKAPARLSQLMEERDSVMMGGVTSSKYSGFTITSSLFPTSSKA